MYFEELRSLVSSRTGHYINQRVTKLFTGDSCRKYGLGCDTEPLGSSSLILVYEDKSDSHSEVTSLLIRSVLYSVTVLTPTRLRAVGTRVFSVGTCGTEARKQLRKTSFLTDFGPRRGPGSVRFRWNVLYRSTVDLTLPCKLDSVTVDSILNLLPTSDRSALDLLLPTPVSIRVHVSGGPPWPAPNEHLVFLVVVSSPSRSVLAAFCVFDLEDLESSRSSTWAEHRIHAPLRSPSEPVHPLYWGKHKSSPVRETTTLFM